MINRYVILNHSQVSSQDCQRGESQCHIISEIVASPIRVCRKLLLDPMAPASFYLLVYKPRKQPVISELYFQNYLYKVYSLRGHSFTIVYTMVATQA